MTAAAPPPLSMKQVLACAGSIDTLSMGIQLTFTPVNQLWNCL